MATPEKRLLVIQLLAHDGIVNTGAGGKEISLNKAMKVVFSGWGTWVHAIIYTLVTGSQTIQYFTPPCRATLLPWIYCAIHDQVHELLLSCPLTLLASTSFVAL